MTHRLSHEVHRNVQLSTLVCKINPQQQYRRFQFPLMLPVYKSPPFCAVLWLLVRNRKDRRGGQQKSREPLFYLFNFLLLLLAILAKEEQMEQGCAVGLQFLLLLMKRERKDKWTRDTKINALNNSIKKEAWNPISSEHILTLLSRVPFR